MSISYFIPDWDDRVDPGYDFLTDKHTPGRNPYRDDSYAHEIYPRPPYDGVLLSRAVLDNNSKKLNDLIKLGSVHTYLRLPKTHKVLGDCGAFSYWEKDVPPYTTHDMVDFYHSLGFDYGVSVDHLIFAHDDAERRRRQELTLSNAEDFLAEHSKECQFIPIGVAQGWSPESYRDSVKKLLQIGYGYIALGGLVRSTTEQIIQILQEVKPELRSDTELHLFGVNRPEHIETFATLGVTSFDSASRLRRAWMDGRRNYFLGNTAFSAIRVPEAQRLAKKNDGIDIGEALRLEKIALSALRAYEENSDASYLEQALTAVLAYDELAGEVTDRTRNDYRETLVRRPWAYCECAICKKINIEVIIFRGNNRNRRRGFHNTWQLYEQLHGHVQELPSPLDASLSDAGQMTLL
ncbi:MAG: tRNA-guanine transglycosylase [Chloroflexales bacterium]|nr:tRNA-guanine transglycosylase [Chloroflexales bacterium]